ncbi:MAG: hypothetical protein WBX01_04350 [Nitrososphaeraceae archaeon]
MYPNAEGESDIIKRIQEKAPEIEIVNGNNSTSVMSWWTTQSSCVQQRIIKMERAQYLRLDVLPLDT